MNAAPPLPTHAVDPPAHTVDVFHRGAYVLVQPAERGHRAGMDAMMLAAAVPSSFAGYVADLGAGAGAAGLAVIARCPEARTLLVEKSPDMAAYAQLTLAHPDNATLAGRASVLTADVTLTGKTRVIAGLDDNAFDFAILNPPFNAARDRQTGDALKKEAHVMEAGLFEKWLRTAAAIVRPRGGVAIIARPESLSDILVPLKGRFGNAEILPIHPRADAAAIRIVVRATRGARGTLSIRPPLVLHEGGDSFSARADDINNGRASLFGD